MIERKVIQRKFSNVELNKAIFPFMVMGFIYLLLLIAKLTTGSAIADGSCEGVQTSLTSSHLHFKDPQFEVGRCGVLKATMKSQLNTPQIAKVELLEKISINSTEKLANSALPISLHSRPSSTRKLFLDFNGYSIPSSSAWNDYWKGNDVRGLSFDSNYSDFSAAENAYIQDIWRAVSEDFSAFNIDVTTEDPGLAGLTRSSESDVYFGAHAVISDDYSQSAVCNCGGVAYVGVVDYIFSSFGATNPYSPNFNFVSFSSGNYVSAADAAGIVSHETGHNLGLGHDGNDSTGYYPGHANGIWAPIMGTSYNKSISQWSKNENRSGQVTSWTQRANSEWIFPSDCTESPSCRDDFLVISENNIPLMVDDYGNEPANSYLVTSKNFSILGYVGANEDEDWFKITADGPIKLSATVTATEKYPNLDIELILKGSNGATLASNNPLVTRNLNGQPAGVNAALSDQMLDPGTYYLIIRGTGALNPLDTGYSRYASVGKFTLNGVIVNRAKTAQTITFAPPAALLSTAFPYTLTATASSGLVPVITSSTTGVCTVSGFTLTMVSAGTCTVVANQAGNATYAPAAAISRSITLSLAPQISLRINNLIRDIFLGNSIDLTVSGGSGTGAISFKASGTGCTVSGARLSATSAATCSVIATKAANSQFLKAESPPVLFNFRSIAGLTIGNLLWSEEFVGEQGGSIDSNKWSARNCHRVPDSLGGGACFGSEAAYYAPSAIKLDGSIDGLAVIQTSRVSNSLPADAGSCLSDSCSFVSGRFDTHGKVGFKYGYIEARIKMPQGSGNHPAFWMLGNNINQVGWPLSGEMDITEIHSNFPKVTTSATHYSSSNVPFTCCSNHFYQVGERNVGVDLSLDFHLYAIAWQPNIIRYYVDGLLVATSTPATLKGNWHFDKAFFLIFNNTVNSEFSGTWENLVSSQMSIDWVRSYTVNGFGEVQIY